MSLLTKAYKSGRAGLTAAKIEWSVPESYGHLTIHLLMAKSLLRDKPEIAADLMTKDAEKVVRNKVKQRYG